MGQTGISTAALEARPRRAARRIGLRACKSRWRVGSIDNFGDFRLFDPETNAVVAGSRFELSAEEVIDRCSESTEDAGAYAPASPKPKAGQRVWR
jgi:hypothetical protein